MIWIATFNPVLSPASPQAQALSDLFVVTLMVCAVICCIVVGLIAWCVLRFRGREGDAEPRQVAGNVKFEASWTLASIFVLVFLFVLTVHAMRIADPPMDRKADITIIGHQWWWEVRYADGTVTANEIHIPTQTDLLVRVDSADVIHCFWVPQLGRKMDAIPGHPNHLWIRADQPGEYTGSCSEFCGAQHAWMRILVVAQPPEEFRAWNSRQAQPAMPSALHGAQVFHDKTCVKCHSIRNTNASIEIGPDLTHFAGRQTIGTGVLKNKASNLRRWLADPQHFKPGCHMPNFQLTNNDLDDLTAYLGTLQ